MFSRPYLLNQVPSMVSNTWFTLNKWWLTQITIRIQCNIVNNCGPVFQSWHCQFTVDWASHSQPEFCTWDKVTFCHCGIWGNKVISSFHSLFGSTLFSYFLIETDDPLTIRCAQLEPTQDSTFMFSNELWALSGLYLNPHHSMAEKANFFFAWWSWLVFPVVKLIQSVLV
jgi:hypothetical protein